MLLTDRSNRLYVVPYTYEYDSSLQGVDLFIEHQGTTYVLCVCGEWHKAGANPPGAREPTLADFQWLLEHDHAIQQLVSVCPAEFREEFVALVAQKEAHDTNG